MNIIDAQFWQATEPDFYKLLNRLAKLTGKTRMAPPEIYLSWFKTLEKFVFQIFEKSTLESTPEDLDLKRIISAQQILRKKFYGNKTIKNLKAKAIHKEAAI
jgi:CRISPR system Cascade subunit CasA